MKLFSLFTIGHKAALLISRILVSRPKFSPVFEDPWPGVVAEGQKIYRGTFQFWGEETVASTPSFWTHPGLTPRFLAILHGFEWLRSLRALSTPESRGVARHYIREWIEQHHAWHDVVWSPDITGQRLASWIGLFDFFGSSADEAFLIKFHKSIIQHVRYLEILIKSTPQDYLDIQTLKGLLIGYLALQTPPAPIIKRIEHFLHSQLLADGSHKIRAPMPQLMILRDLLDIRLALLETDQPLPAGLHQAIQKLAAVIRFFRHGDGGLALFQNSIEGTSSFTDMILSQTDAPSKHLERLEEGGFYRLQDGRGLLLFDVGSPVTPQALNLDRLGFEFSYGSHRLIVNGTRSLQAAPSQLLSSPLAQISGTAVFFDSHHHLLKEGDAAASPYNNVMTMADRKGHLICADWEERCAGHRLRHQRTLTLLAEGAELRGEDLVVGPENGAVLLRITFHPALKASLKKGSASIHLITPDGLHWRFTAHRHFELSLHQGYYYGIDNKESFCSQALIKVKTGAQPCLVKWTLRLVESIP